MQNKCWGERGMVKSEFVKANFTVPQINLYQVKASQRV